MPLISTATADYSATSGDDTIVGTATAQAFVFDNTIATGQDTITAFGKNDSFLFTSKLYDSNGNDIITFGEDKRLDTFDGADGLDDIKVGGIDPSKGVRYLGEKDGYFVYADATVRPAGSKEGTVGDDTLSGASGNVKFFYDTALGLNLGADKINGAGAGDTVVTTSKIWDSNNDNFINLGGDHVLQLPGAGGGIASDPSVAPGGTITFDPDVSGLKLLSTTTWNTVTYYTYGVVDA